MCVYKVRRDECVDIRGRGLNLDTWGGVKCVGIRGRG